MGKQKISFKEVAHLYFPFHFTWVEDAIPFKKGETGIMSAEDWKYWDEDCKRPILRKLEDMTDEECAHLGFNVGNPFVKRENWISLVLLGIEGKLSPYQFKYMLSIGLDLFGLIDSGLAIDKKTLS